MFHYCLESEHANEDHHLGYAKIDWEKSKYEDITISVVNSKDEDDITETPINEFEPFDIAIAAEVIYWEQSILPLISILDVLFAKQDNNLVFYLIFLERTTRLHKQLKEAFEKYGFTYEYIQDPITQGTAVYE